eukprot:230509_1
MNYQEPNLSNVPKSPALPEESSSPQSEAAADPRFVMPSISPFPMNRTVISTATIDSQSSQPQLRQQTQQRQPIIPLPFLSANPQLAQSANINHMNMNRSTNQRNIVRGPMCHNAQQQTQQVQQHRQAHHPSQPGYHPSLYNGMNHQQITHQNRFNNNELCVTNTAQQQHQLQQQQHQHHQQQQQQQQALRHGSQAQVQQSAQSAAARMSNMGTMNTMNGNNMRLHQLTQNQTRNQPQNAANNIANVNHIQNKYNTTIINLNGSLNGNLNGLMDSVVQMNGEVDNQCVVPYPSNGQHHGAQNNINMIRARARSNAAVPMSASLTKRGSIMAGKYKILSVLADGTFSRTVCAQDIKTLRLVAIKIMKDKCQYVGVQEAKRLAFFNSKDAEDLCHVVRFVETIHYQTRFCLVLEILGISLFKYLQINQFATLNVVRKVAIQLMISMQFVHSFNQIHADLKPENVLLVKESTTQRKAIRSSKNCKIKVIDFGNSISLAESEAYFDKFEIQSLYYRAPEVVLGCRFGCAIDIWSCGCILMELVLGAPLFATHNKSALCHKIHSVLGPFPIHAYQNAKFYKEYFNKPSYITHQSVYSELYTQRYEGIDKILKSKYNQMGHEWTIDHDYFVQFIACLLDLDPKTRMKASDAFFHPFLQKLFPFRAVFDHKKQSKDSELNAQDITLGQNDHEHDTVSLSNIDLSDSDALQKHKNLICNKQRFGAECTKLPSNFRNPLIHQLQPHPHAITHTHQCQSHHHHHPAAAAAMPQPQPHHQQQQQQQHMQQQMNQHQQQQQMHSMQQQQQ